MQLSPHFTLEELTVTGTGLDNTPSEAEIEVLRKTAEYMEVVRSVLGGNPIIVNSAFRSEAVNDAVHGVKDSAHRLGFAVDFTCPDFSTPFGVARAIVHNGGIPFDQIIHERIISEGSDWVHISRDPRNRHQIMTTFDRVS